MLHKHFLYLENIITNSEFVIKSIINKEINDENKGIFEAKIFFEKYILAFLEVIDIQNKKLTKIKYKYND